ncbi:MAG: hypothetical protein IPO21_02675 [Bacteroidales bacterium]|nr:hypothetical protein [Bacteroidales bacterium]
MCYFGAIDAWLSKGKKSKNSISNKWHWKIGILVLVIGMAILFRIFQIAVIYAILFSVLFGLLGIAVMLFLTRKHKQMWHCAMFCPIGTLVSMLKFASPFRMSIANNCTQCMKCLPSCKYDALTVQDVKNGKPGLTCTYCGDCLNSCSSVSIQYHFLGSSGKNARYLFLFLSVSLHAISLALARI